MKKLMILAWFILSMASANAIQCVSKDGVVFENNTEATLYYVSSPKNEMGPGYNCELVKRVRTCTNGVLDIKPRVCSDEDSGGCADFWLDQLEDQNFQYGNCQD